ncbi:uncharacterized protein LOC120469919 isoform X3 [Pimephales promelas]|uniref:uncharacterized protein LOC120469919 isoform X3 n=1 Tax=Pimephales promelas TaxID=90988 RepID=UPI001955E2BE|nr:uncharacterized protein LOC120469919 isoform X3 [Pimephales promelas]
MSLLEKIVVIEGHGEDGTEFPFTLPCLFGRKLDCDNHIQLPQVSDEHRKIELNENNELILTNLSSVNPSRINGHVINQSEQLKHGDLIIDRSFRFDPPPKTLTAGQDKTVQALQEQQEKSTPVHPEKRKSEHSFGLQVRTAEFIKMRADHDYLFTGDKNSASEAWGEVLKKMGLLGKHTPTEARGKWKYLKKKYKDCIRKGESAKTWQWFALMDKVLGKRHSTNPRFQLASSPEDTPDSSSAEDEEEPRPPPAKRKRGHVDELIEISDESTQSPTQTQANTPQPGSPDSPYVPSLFTPKTSRRTLALERTAEEDQPCVLNGINSKPDEVEHFLLSLAGPLRHLPPRSRSEVKIKFQQILHEAEFNNQENSIRHT